MSADYRTENTVGYDYNSLVSVRIKGKDLTESSPWHYRNVWDQSINLTQEIMDELNEIWKQKLESEKAWNEYTKKRDSGTLNE